VASEDIDKSERGKHLNQMPLSTHKASKRLGKKRAKRLWPERKAFSHDGQRFVVANTTNLSMRFYSHYGSSIIKNTSPMVCSSAWKET
jgi:hypothetical protein